MVDIDAQTQEAFHRGENDAIRKVYVRMAPSLRSSLLPYFQPPDVDDALQELFYHAAAKSSQYDPKRRLYPWLAKVVRNKVVDNHRKRMSRLRWEEVHYELYVTDNHNPQSSYIANDQISRLETGLQQLKEPRRTLWTQGLSWLEMQVVGGLSTREIAELHDTSWATVNSRMHDVKVFAQKYLK